MQALSRGWTLALVALLVTPTARAGGPALEWELTDCALQLGDTLILSNCSGACTPETQLNAEAETTITAAGTLTLQLAWSASGFSYLQSLSVQHNGDSVLVKDSEADWCPMPDCSGVETLTLPVAAGDTLRIALAAFTCSGPVTCTFGVDFAPVAGFGPGFGALDDRLISTVQGQEQDEGLGQAMAFMGDLDGDGQSDLAIGVNDNFVLLVSGATGETILSIPKPPITGEDFGGALAALGDLDGDGLQELLVGNAGPAIANGPVRVFSGATGQLLFSEWSQVPGNELFGEAVAAAGDLDADGVPDLLVSAPGADILGTNTGAVRAYSGATFGLLLEVPGQPGDFAGDGVASVGDINGDGTPDIALGAPGSDALALDSGLVRLHSGVDGALLGELPGPALTGADFGSVVVAGGDHDADGFLDILASAPYANTAGNDSGQVRAYSGATQALLFTLDGEEKDFLGYSLAAAGDWNGDGHDDALAGGWLDSYVVLISGDSHEILVKLEIDLPYLYFGSEAPTGSGFGNTLGGAADASGDGRPDFAVGATHWEPVFPGTEDLGKVFIYSGNSADYVAPTLTGAGTLLAGSTLSLNLGGGDPFAPAVLVVGTSALVAPLKGGLLVPSAHLLVPLVLDGAGSTALQATWPPFIPSGTTLWLQAWLPDADGFAGFFASESLTLTTP